MGHTPADLVVTVPATYFHLFLVIHSQNTELNTPTLLPGKNEEDLHLEVWANLLFFFFFQWTGKASKEEQAGRLFLR